MNVNKFPDPRQRYPDVSMTEAEAASIIEFERIQGRPLSCKASVVAALKIERATPDEFNRICYCLGISV